jgi:signal-transduction protein with cAMP-binding, CBS, and nucleotidyltransferase domain
MARERKWRKSLEEWQAEVHHWVFSLDPQTVMNCDIFFDFQPVWGDRDLAEELRGYAIDKASQSAFFLQYLTQNVAQMETAVGLFGQFVTKQGRLNAKKLAILPLISAARLRAIRAHVTATATDERYTKLKDMGQLHEDDLRDFVEVREVVFKAMLEQQLADLAQSVPPSARLDPRRFDKRTRLRLRWAFSRLKALKYVCGVGR